VGDTCELARANQEPGTATVVVNSDADLDKFGQ